MVRHGDKTTTHLALCQRILDLVDFDLAKALDLQQVAASCCMHGGDSVVTIGFKLGNIACIDAMSLDGFDVDNVAVL